MKSFYFYYTCKSHYLTKNKFYLISICTVWPRKPYSWRLRKRKPPEPYRSAKCRILRQPWRRLPLVPELVEWNNRPAHPSRPDAVGRQQQQASRHRQSPPHLCTQLLWDEDFTLDHSQAKTSFDSPMPCGLGRSSRLRGRSPRRIPRLCMWHLYLFVFHTP